MSYSPQLPQQSPSSIRPVRPQVVGFNNNHVNWGWGAFSVRANQQMASIWQNASFMQPMQGGVVSQQTTFQGGWVENAFRGLLGLEPRTEQTTTIQGNPQGTFFAGGPTFGGGYYNNGLGMGGYNNYGVPTGSNSPAFPSLNYQNQQKVLAGEQNKAYQEQQKLERELNNAQLYAQSYPDWKVEIKDGELVATHKDGYTASGANSNTLLADIRNKQNDIAKADTPAATPTDDPSKKTGEQTT